MRLYPTHLGLSTPFVVFFFKKANFFLMLKINPLKTRIYSLKNFSTFFQLLGVFMDKPEILGKHSLF